MQKRTVFIVGGGGMVGSTAAHAIALKEAAHEIVLIDVAEELARGQAIDINHATAYTNGVHVRTGSYDQIKTDDIVVITSGVAQKPGQSRRELLSINANIIRSVVQQVMKAGHSVFIVLVANPVDVLTQVALETSGLPKERVFGTGTMLDTARLRVTLANALHVSQKDVQADVLGEHGDASFVALSNARIGGIPLTSFPGFTEELTTNIAEDIQRAAYDIIKAKRSTYHGIGSVIATLVEALGRKTSSVLPLCSLATGEYGLRDVVIGLPCMVSADGVKIIENYPLSGSEHEQLRQAARVIKANRKTLLLDAKNAA